MKVRINSPKPAAAVAVPEAEPELADRHETASGGTRPAITQPRNGDTSDEFGTVLAMHRATLLDSDEAERPVKIYSYMGSLSDNVGHNGDFYIDEMTNMLYGPKKAGVWPEDGASAAGLCQRTWIGMTRTRLTRGEPETGLMPLLRHLLRLLLPFRLVKGIGLFSSSSSAS